MKKLKTKITGERSGWNGRKIVTEVFTDPPYTVFGSTSLPQEFHITMTVKGLRQMLEGLSDDDSFGVTCFANNRATEYSFIRGEKKEKKKISNKKRNKHPKTWSRKGRCPSCNVGSGSKHTKECTVDYDKI